jgi:hypothetical protein
MLLAVVFVTENRPARMASVADGAERHLPGIDA